MRTPQISKLAVAVLLAAGVGLAAPVHAAPINGQAIADSISASILAEPVRLVCPWSCAEFKTTAYGPICIKRVRNCYLTPELRRLPPPAPTHR